MLKLVPWHWIFALLAAPGLLVAMLMYRHLRDSDAKIAAVHTDTHDASPHSWSDAFRYCNIPLGIVGMLCWLTNLVVLGAMLPGYLTEYLHLGIEQMGFVLSAIGFGGALGALLMPALSDRLGRKPVMVLSVTGAFFFLALLARCDANLPKLFALSLHDAVFHLRADHAHRGPDQRGIGTRQS